MPLPPWGDLRLDPSATQLFLQGTIGGTGADTHEIVVPNVPELAGSTLYFQALVLEDLPTGQGQLTNLASVTFP